MYYSLFTHPCDIFYCAVQVDGNDLQHDDDAKEDTDNINTLQDFASKICLDPLMTKESFDQETEEIVGLDDQEMEDVTRATDETDQNLVLLVVSENRRKRARAVGEGNSMDKLVDRVKRKNPEDVPGNLHIPTVLNSSNVSLSDISTKSGVNFEVILLS